MKLDDWIKPYGLDDQMEQTELSMAIVQYLIPAYKIDRLKEADNNADLLERYCELGTPEEISSALEKAKDTIIKLRDDLNEVAYKNLNDRIES